MAVVGNAGGDGAGFESDPSHERNGRRGVLVAIDHGDFENVLRRVGDNEVVMNEWCSLSRSGDDLTVEGFDDANRGGFCRGADGKVRR